MVALQTGLDDRRTRQFSVWHAQLRQKIQESGHYLNYWLQSFHLVHNILGILLSDSVKARMMFCWAKSEAVFLKPKSAGNVFSSLNWMF